MFLMKKKSGKYEYLQIEGIRDIGKVRQRALLTLGTCTEWIAGGKLDSLLVSGIRLSKKLAIISEHQAGNSKPVVCKRLVLIWYSVVSGANC